MTTVRVRAPGRVNLIGDHTDYTGGLVFPMAIDRWTQIVGEVAPRVRLVSEYEPGAVAVTDRADGESSGLPRWGRFVDAVAAEIEAPQGIEGEISTTIPIGAGLSSSAALEVALALAFGFEGSPLEVAQLAQRAEHRATGVPTGIMDQLCITSARSGHATMIDCHALTVTHVPMPDDLDVVVQYIEHRTLEGSEYSDRVRQCTEAEAIIGPLRLATLDDLSSIADPIIHRRARHVIAENARVREFAAALASGNYCVAGELMVLSHRSLRDDFATSTPTMDAAVDRLIADPRVLGARMTGGGFGGCVVALCRQGASIDGWTVRPVRGAERLHESDDLLQTGHPETQTPQGEKSWQQ